MTSLTPESLAALRALAEKATPGPWVVHVCGGCVGSSSRNVAANESLGECPLSEADASYLAALSPDVVLALLDRLKSLEAREASALAARSGSPHPVKQADEDGLAWFDVLTRSASPGTPCTIQVGFARALLERLRETEALRDEHLRSWQAALEEVTKARIERDKAKAAALDAMVEAQKQQVRAEAAEALILEMEAHGG